MQRNDQTKLAVEAQVRAMGCNVFDIGLLDMNFREKDGSIGERMETRTWSKETLLNEDTIKHLKLRNMKGQNIYIRPSGTHSMTLLDDLPGAKVLEMKRTGFSPALVVETSPNNYQAWLKHGQVLDQETSTAAARLCAQKFDADPGSADWRHFGRLAGFTNRKEKHRQPNGYYPFVKLKEASGQLYDSREEILQGAVEVVSTRVAEEQKRREAYAAQRTQFQQLRQSSGHAPQEKTIEDFHADPRYGGDLTRSDLAYATYAVGKGKSHREIESALASRDLSHKGAAKRQQDYINRTISKAVERASGKGLSR